MEIFKFFEFLNSGNPDDLNNYLLNQSFQRKHKAKWPWYILLICVCSCNFLEKVFIRGCLILVIFKSVRQNDHSLRSSNTIYFYSFALEALSFCSSLFFFSPSAQIQPDNIKISRARRKFSRPLEQNCTKYHGFIQTQFSLTDFGPQVVQTTADKEKKEDNINNQSHASWI